MIFVPKPGILNPASVRADLIAEMKKAGWQVKARLSTNDLAIEVASDSASAAEQSRLARYLATKGYHPEGTLTYLPAPVAPERDSYSFNYD